MLAVVCLAFISLLIVCSASWVIKSLTDQYFKWPTWTTTDATELDTYINDVYEDTLDEYFTTGGVYNGQSQAPKLKDVDAANALFGHLRRDGEGDDDFLERMNDEAFTAYWEAGLYFNYTNNNGTKVIDYQGDREKVAGTHYYRIVDANTGSVICYKHTVTVTQDTIQKKTVNITGGGDTPRFVWESIKFNVIWNGVVNTNTNFRSPVFDGTVGELMADEGVSFGSSPGITDEVSIQIENCEGLDAMDANNFDLSTAEDITFEYTAIATVYSNINTKTYYGSVVQALDATDDLAFDETQGRVVAKDEAPAGTHIIPMQSFSYTYTTTDASGNTATVKNNYVVGAETEGTTIGFEHTVDADCLVGADVTLIIPYDTTMSYFNTSTNAYTYEKTTGNNPSALEKATPLNYIKVTATLENKGNIIIPGLISGGNASYTQNSITTGRHSRIILGENAKLKGTSGNITCYGHITEETHNNGSQVIMTGGNIDMVFTIVEHRGGSAFSGLINITSPSYLKRSMESSPFNRFYVESITSDLVVYEGATVVGLGYMVVADTEVEKKIGFFGTSSSDFVQFDTSTNDAGRKTKVTFKYDTDKRQNQMKIEGSVKVNPLQLEMSINVVIATAVGNMNTTNVFLPLSHYWNISFNRYSSEFNYSNYAAIADATIQDIKIMPGASMTIGEDTTFKSKNIAVYYKDTNIPTMGAFDYYAKSTDDIDAAFNKVNYKYNTYVDGELIVNGTLDTTAANNGAGASVGGVVKTTSSKGVLISKASNSVISKEVNKDSRLDGGWTPNTLTLVGKVADGAGAPTNQTLEANTYYYSTGNAWAYDKTITINYNVNGDDAAPVASMASKTATVRSNIGLTLNDGSEYLTTPGARNYYTFDEWYVNGASAIGQTVYSNVTLDAQWNAIEYKVNVINVYPEGDPVTEINKYQFNQSDGDFTLPTLTHSSYKVRGWYTDALYEHQIYKLDRTLFDPTGEVTEITIYLRWVADGYNFVLGQYNDKDVVINDSPVTLNNVDLDPTELNTALTSLATYMTDTYKTSTNNKYYFLGWECTAAGITFTINDGATYQDIVTAAIAAGVPSSERRFEISAIWKQKAMLKYTANDTSVYTALITNGSTALTYGTAYWYEPGTTIKLPNVSAYDATINNANYKRYFNGWTLNGQTFTQTGNTDYVLSADSEFKITWGTKATINIQFWDGTLTVTTKNASGATLDTLSTSSNISSATNYYFRPGTITVNYAPSNSDEIIFKIDDATKSYPYTATIAEDGSMKVYADSNNNVCLAEGTLITLADGTKKKVEDLTYDDLLLIFNHETGKVETGYVALLPHIDEEARWVKVINLNFSNGEILRIVIEHGLFDATLNKYVYINENTYADYIGHEFYYTYYNGSEFVGETVTLVDAYVTEELVRIFCPVSVWHWNVFANGLLTVPGGLEGKADEGLFNFFELDENMKYDEEKMKADIEKYGLYTYDDFDEYLTEEQFNALPLAQLKVSVGKGNMTWDDVMLIVAAIISQSP